MKYERKFVTTVIALKSGGFDIVMEDGETVFVGPEQQVMIKQYCRFEVPDGIKITHKGDRTEVIDKRPRKQKV